MHGRLVTVQTRPALRFERPLGHSLDRVWRALTDPEELRQWYPGVPDWELQLGATFTNEEGVEGGQITALDPPRLLAYSWGSQQFRFELSHDHGGCRLTFTHVFDERELGAQLAAGWELCFKRLDAHLEGGFLSDEEAQEGVPEVHERYAESFGLSPEVGRRRVASAR